MAYYLRAPRSAHVGRLIGSFPDQVFITSAPVVMHDRCAERAGHVADPHDVSRKGRRAHFDARDAFAARAGEHWDLCWSLDADTAPCYECGAPVCGRG